MSRQTEAANYPDWIYRRVAQEETASCGTSARNRQSEGDESAWSQEPSGSVEHQLSRRPVGGRLRVEYVVNTTWLP